MKNERQKSKTDKWKLVQISSETIYACFNTTEKNFWKVIDPITRQKKWC